MTTRVKVELDGKHMPVVVEVLRSDGKLAYIQVLRELGDVANEYVHSGQTLRIREMTTAELHDAAITVDAGG